MIEHVMTDLELQLLIELLEAERGRLPHEIHHTDNRDFRHALYVRQRNVERLVERFRQMARDHQPPASVEQA